MPTATHRDERDVQTLKTMQYILCELARIQAQGALLSLELGEMRDGVICHDVILARAAGMTACSEIIDMAQRNDIIVEVCVRGLRLSFGWPSDGEDNEVGESGRSAPYALCDDIEDMR